MTIPEYQKRYRERNKDKVKEWNKNYRLRHKEELQKYRDANKDNQKEYDKIKRENGKNNPEFIRAKKESDKKYRANLKEKFLIMYGSKCNCPECNESNPLFLTLDHINNDGCKVRKNKNNTQEYIKATKEYRPDIYQILCYNCNCSKDKNNGMCPHFGLNHKDNAQSRYWMKLKKTFIDVYGGKCMNCGENNIGFLTMDHIQNDGHAQRKINSIKQEYLEAIKNKDTDKYTVLCWNCNCTKNVEGGLI